MSTTGHYDQNLLASAPAATKAQLQEGYTTDLLNPTHRRTPSPHPVQSEDAHLAPQSDIERDSISPSKEFNGTPKPPFWRTTKGIVIIIVAILIVLGAVIGGAVGGTRNKGGSSVALATPTTTSSQSNSTSLLTPPSPVVTDSGLTAASSIAAATGSAAAGVTTTTAAEGSLTTLTDAGPGAGAGPNQAAGNIAVGS